MVKLQNKKKSGMYCNFHSVMYFFKLKGLNIQAGVPLPFSNLTNEEIEAKSSDSDIVHRHPVLQIPNVSLVPGLD